MTLHSRLAAEGLAVLVACSALGFERLATLAVLAAVVWARYQALTRGPQRDAQLFERVHPILAAVFAEKEAAEAKRKGTSPGEELVELRSLVELFAERKKDAESPPSPPKRKDGLSFPAVEEVRAAVCKDPQVVAAMQKTGQEVGAVLRILDKMQSTPSERVFQIVAFVIQRFLGLIFSLGVHIAEDDVQRLRDAEATGNPIVLLPTHRSHVDYCVTSLFLYVNGLRMPYVVAGENLNQPVLGTVLRSCGAFFIKRSFGGDVLYGTVFNAYVRALLQRKITVECFVEGGRTRTGKLLQPKAGFLRTAVECVQNEEVSDVLVVPVSIVYDRVIEGSAYAMEQSGGTKQKEAILTIIGGWWNLFRRRVLTFSTFGSVVVTVAQPFSLRQYWQARSRREAEATPSSRGSGEERLAVARSIGYAALYHCNEVSVIVPTALVGTVMLLHRDRGISPNALNGAVEWLQTLIVERGGRLKRHEGAEGVDTQELVRRDVDTVVKYIMGGQARFIKKHKNLIMTVFTPTQRIELAYYRNQLIHIFVQEALLAVAAFGIVQARIAQAREDKVARRTRSPYEEPLTKAQLLVDCEFLSRLVKEEFIFRPTVVRNRSALEKNFDLTMRRMIDRGVFAEELPPDKEAAASAKGPESPKSKSPPRKLESLRNETFCREPGTENDVPVWGVTINPDLVWTYSEGGGCLTKRNLWCFLCSLMFPFIDSSFLVLLSCFAFLRTKKGFNDDALVRAAQEAGEKLYFAGMLDNYEAVTKDSLKTSVATFLQMGVLSALPVENVGTVLQVKLTHDELFRDLGRLNTFRNVPEDYDLNHAIDLLN